MKAISIISLVVFCAVNCFSQQNKEFEGRVYYAQTLTSNNPQLDTAALKDDLGRSSIYSYKTGKIRWDIESKSLEYQISDLVNNEHVLKFLWVDSLFKVDYSKEDTLVSYKITKNADTICGYVCDKIETFMRSCPPSHDFKRTVWFSSRLYADPKPFRNLGTYAMNKLVPLIKAVPLAILLESELFTMKFTAVKVEAVELPDYFFTIDKSLPISYRLWNY